MYNELTFAEKCFLCATMSVRVQAPWLVDPSKVWAAFQAAEDPEVYKHLSASQLKTLGRCETLYHIEKVSKLLTDDDRNTVATSFGKDRHAEWEAYLEFGTMPSHPCTLRTLPVLPLPGVSLVEPAVWVDSGIVPIFGFIDYFIEDQGAVADSLPESIGLGDLEGIPLVGDHKTSANVKRYAMKDSDLDTDIQALVYAEWARVRTGAPMIDLRWTYSGSKDKQMKVTQRRLVASYVEDKFQEVVVPLVRDAMTTRMKELLDTTPNEDACYDYGHCKVARFCHKPEVEDLESLIEKFF